MREIVVLLDLLLSNPFLVILALILLIFTNFYLLKHTYRLRNQNLAQHYSTPFYVLNPSQRGIIEDDEPLTWGLWLTWGFQIIFAALGSIIYSNQWPVQNVFLCGEIIIGIIIGRYLRSILVNLSNSSYFQLINNHPNAIKGKLIFSSKLLFFESRSQLILTASIWQLICLLTERVFFLGGSLEAILMVFLTFKWERDAFEGKLK
ncbi:MAG: hypothetical protein ACFFAU_19030 [Candidatus Hodarchaeota archaeon]